MQFKYKNYELNLDENKKALQSEVIELKKLANLIQEHHIYHSLAGKTQLIGKNKVPNARARLNHSEDIAMLAKRFVKAIYETVVDDEVKEEDIYSLNLERDLLYTQIIAKTHDWGHTPHGHLGERVINKCLQSLNISEENLENILSRKEQIYGKDYEIQQGHIKGKTKKISFEHNEQSAKILYDFLHRRKDINLDKIDISRLIQGILSHSTSRVKSENIPDDIVAQIVRQIDKLEEYMTNDFEEVKDFIKWDNIVDKQLRSFLELPKKERIKITLQQLLNETLEKGCIDDEMQALENSKKMKKNHHRYIFMMDTDGKKGLLTGENEERIMLMLEKIFQYYIDHGVSNFTKISYQGTPIQEDEPTKRLNIYTTTLSSNDIALEEKVVDYLCLMDNEKVERTYYKLVQERLLKGEGFGIEPITSEEIQAVKESNFNREISLRKLNEGSEGVEHSEEETIAGFEEEIQEIKRRYLTPKAIARMKQVRALHLLENEKDVQLCAMMKEYDDVQNGKRKKIVTQRSQSDIVSASQEVKEKWEKKTELSNNIEER